MSKNHRHKWVRTKMLDEITELVECKTCPARIARLVLRKEV